MSSNNSIIYSRGDYGCSSSNSSTGTDISSIQITNPTANQLLKYNSIVGKFVNVDIDDLGSVRNGYIPLKTGDNTYASASIYETDTQIIFTKSGVFPPGSVDIGDSRFESGARIITAISNTTGNQGAFLIQLIGNTSFSPPTIYDPTTTLTQFDLQTTADSVESGTSETTLINNVANSVLFRYVEFKPAGGSITSNFTLKIALTSDPEPNQYVYNEVITPSSTYLTDRGNGIFRLHLRNPSGLDSGNTVYIFIEDINLLGGENISNSLVIGDPDKNNYFPWLRAGSIPITRQQIAHRGNIVSMLEGLTGDDKLQYSALRNIPTLVSNVVANGSQITVTKNDSTSTNIPLSKERIGYVHSTQQFSIVASGGITTHGQFEIYNTTNGYIKFATQSPLITPDYVIAFAGSGLSDEGAELVYMDVTGITTEAQGDPLSPTHYLITLDGTFWKGRAEKDDQLNPIAFGAVGQNVVLKFLDEREITAVEEVFTLPEKDKLESVATGAQVNDTTGFNNAISTNNSLRFTRQNGNNLDVTVSPYTRSYMNLGQGATGGSISLDNINAGWVHFHPDIVNTTSVKLATNSDINNDKVFVLDASDIDENLTFNIEKANTVFSDGSTSTVIMANHILFGFAHTNQPLQPISSTNKLYIYTFQAAADGYSPVFHPDFANTVVLAMNGDDTLDGSNFTKAVSTISRAMTLASTFSSGNHKQILSLDVHNYGAFTNDNTTGNVANLIVNALGATFSNVTLEDHATRFLCRHVSGNVVLGDQCDLETGVIGDSSTRTITFSSEVHNTTRLKCKRVESTCTLSFAGVSSGSHIHVEIDRYESGITTVIGTIPSGVSITGYIEDFNFAERLVMPQANGTLRYVTINNDGSINTETV